MMNPCLQGLELKSKDRRYKETRFVVLFCYCCCFALFYTEAGLNNLKIPSKYEFFCVKGLNRRHMCYCVINDGSEP